MISIVVRFPCQDLVLHDDLVSTYPPTVSTSCTTCACVQCASSSDSCVCFTAKTVGTLEERLMADTAESRKQVK